MISRRAASFLLLGALVGYAASFAYHPHVQELTQTTKRLMERQATLEGLVSSLQGELSEAMEQIESLELVVAAIRLERDSLRGRLQEAEALLVAGGTVSMVSVEQHYHPPGSRYDPDEALETVVILSNTGNITLCVTLQYIIQRVNNGSRDIVAEEEVCVPALTDAFDFSRRFEGVVAEPTGSPQVAIRIIRIRAG